MYNIKGVLSRPHSVQLAVHHGPYKPGGCGVDRVQVLLGVLTGLLENQEISRTTTLSFQPPTFFKAGMNT